MTADSRGAFMRSRPVLAAGAVALAIAVAGCGSSSGGAQASKTVDPNSAEVSPPGDIPDNQAFVAYSPAGSDYTVKVPEGWARRSVNATTTFTDKLNSVSMREVTAKAPLTARTAAQTEVPKLARSVKGFQAGKVDTVTRQGGTAVRISFLADATTDPVTGKTGKDAVEQYRFFNGGHEIVLTLSGPKGADNVDPWKIVSDSVRWSS
jgi:hypothetical protein